MKLCKLYGICYNGLMRRLHIVRDKFALVDDEDYKFLSRFRWGLHSNGYAKTSLDMYMHRLLLGAGTTRLVVDHIDGDPLNNQKHNLRLTNQSVNLSNTNKSNGVSKYRGVYLQGSRWVTQFRHKHIGSFASEIEAARAYQIEKQKYIQNETQQA